MGLDVCYRDGNVEKYGLVNALLPVGTILLEVVSPFREGTAAGRFIGRTALIVHARQGWDSYPANRLGSRR